MIETKSNNEIIEIRDNLLKRLSEEYKGSDVLRCFIEIEIQRVLLDKSDFKSVRNVAKIVKDETTNRN